MSDGEGVVSAKREAHGQIIRHAPDLTDLKSKSMRRKEIKREVKREKESDSDSGRDFTILVTMVHCEQYIVKMTMNEAYCSFRVH